MSSLVAADGGLATDSAELPLPDSVLTSIDPQHVGSVTQDNPIPSATANVRVTQNMDHLLTDSSDFATDTMDLALPSSDGLTLDSVGSFSWDEGDLMDGVWQFTQLVSHTSIIRT